MEPGRQKLLVCGCTVWDEIYRSRRRLVENHKYVNQGLPSGCPGGMAARTAWLTAHMGVPTVLVSTVGKDQAGITIGRWLRAAGVDCSVLTQEGQTSRSFIFVSQNGKRTPLMSMSPALSNQTLTRRSLEDLLEDVALGFFDGTGNEALQGHIAQALGERGIPVIINVERKGSITEKMTGQATIVIMAEEYLRVACPGSPLKRALRRQPIGHACKAIGVTLGKKGSVFLERRTSRLLDTPAYDVQSVVDETGAGDAFAAGILVGENRQLPFSEILALATALGSFVVEHEGFLEEAPREQDIRKRLDAVTQKQKTLDVDPTKQP